VESAGVRPVRERIDRLDRPAVVVRMRGAHLMAGVLRGGRRAARSARGVLPDRAGPSRAVVLRVRVVVREVPEFAALLRDALRAAIGRLAETAGRRLVVLVALTARPVRLGAMRIAVGTRPVVGRRARGAAVRRPAGRVGPRTGHSVRTRTEARGVHRNAARSGGVRQAHTVRVRPQPAVLLRATSRSGSSTRGVRHVARWLGCRCRTTSRRGSSTTACARS
jgi:hypothetical protein